MGEGVLASALWLDRNLALIAGAGSGKTHSLVTLGLQLLAGARPGASPLPPSKLVMVTFTDKAAAELRERLRHRVEALSRKEGKERELLFALAQQGRDLPGPLFWRQTADQLSGASVVTFHSLCAQILRRAPAGSDRWAELQVLEDWDAQGLLGESAERLVLEELQREEPMTAALCRELGYSGGEFTLGLVDHLCSIFQQSREQVSPSRIAVSEPEECARALRASIERVRELVEKATAADRARGGRFANLLAGCERALNGLTKDNFLEPSRFPALRTAIEAEPSLGRQRNGAGELLKELKGWAVPNGAGRITLLDHYGACVVPPLERAFRELLVKLERRYRSELARRKAVDFSELMLATRDLLRDSLPARSEVQARVGALLVDECQDTNWLQAEIVNLIAEKREGAPRPLDPGELRHLPLPLEPRFLCVVGDPKQSIYDFRGADVSVFGRLVSKIEEEDGRSAFLRVNRRSTPRLLSFWNRTFRRLMSTRPEQRDYEVDYRPEKDDQTASRVPQPSPILPVDWLVFEPAATAEECRFLEARAIAQRIRELLSPHAPGFVEDVNGEIRKPRGGDFALLLRRFTFVEVYRQALSQLGIPHRVIRGRGFYCAPEVMDLASLLSLIATAEDSLALAAVLRSPWVAVSDASLFRLAAGCGGRLSLQRVQHLPSLLELGLPQAEAQRLERFLRLYPQLRAERDRMGIRSLLRVALEELGYRIAVAGTPFGEQALSNIDKVLDLADGWDRAGRGDCASFAQRMRELADEDPVEAQADSFEAGDPRAVQIMTIHQAKGLEFPIVVVADLGAQRNRNNGRVLFERNLGLAVKPWVGENSEVTRSPRFQQLAAELSRREDAEYLRLLYVAMTRARDHLILSGQNRRQAGTWRELLQQLLDGEPDIRASVQQLAISDVEVPAPPIPSTETSPEALAEVDQVLLRVRQPKALRSESAVFPVTHLQDYVLCPRRYLYAHHLGLREFSLALEVAAEDEAQAGSGLGDYRQRGTLIHRLLELTELSWIGGSDTQLRARLAELLWSLGVQPTTGEGREIIGSVHRFLRTRFAARLAAAGDGRVHRELAFMLRIGDAPSIHLKGQIDLLFADESGGATVIDYKAGRRHPRGTDAYRFQLDCYALAARHFVNEGVRVQTGIAFLAERNPEPEIREVRQLDMGWFETELYRSATSLLQSTPRFDWSGLPAAQCTSLGCGYQYRCHSHPPEL